MSSPADLRPSTVLAACLAVLHSILPLSLAGAEPLVLEKGDHIAIIGNAQADRMQHHGWLEALIHRAHPEHDLVVRNLGVSGDELAVRFRSENFGSPDEWLAKVEADVVFAFFGFNESFAGIDGLEGFRAELEGFIDALGSTSFNGESPPRVVLFSPIAHEDLGDPDLPDGSAGNGRLRYYVEAMKEMADSRGVLFVDLFEASRVFYENSPQHLTFNGVHLRDVGDEMLAPFAFRSVFGREAPATTDPEVLRIREAVLDKNWEWFQRYRTVDGYNVYGGRSQLVYNDISNFQVMQEEMSVRDILTANRDKRIWAVARGGDLVVDDANLPPVTPVPTNKPGSNPDGSHVFLGGEEAIARMKVAAGCRVNLFASEEEYPELANPVQMAWDARGRLWVAAWPNYPGRTPESTTGDGLLVFEDTDHDGRADSVTPFLDDLNCPTGFQFYRDGVLVMQAPDLWFVRDTDGDGRADWRESILNGMDSADTHHTTNAMAVDPGGAIYLSDGVFHRSQVETLWGPVRNEDGCIYRFEPRTGRFERYVAYGFANPHGRVFDHWGNDIITDATGNANYFGPAFSGHIDFPGKHAGMREFWNRPSRPCPGTGMLYSRHFPEEFQGNFLNCNVIGFQGIFRARVTEDGSGLKGETIEHLVESDDPNFRPSAVNVGPDGAVYFLDWHNPIIGHMQHHLRDPSRDHRHGRIYRITFEGRPLLVDPPIAGEPIDRLLELLELPEPSLRDRVKIELSGRDSSEVTAAVDRWIAALDANDPDLEHHVTEALWVKQYHNRVDPALLDRVLSSPDHRARAAAGGVLCYWRDRIPEALARFARLADDPHPRVRLEAVRGASFFRESAAAEVALAALRHPTDYYLDYTIGETIRQLEPFWRAALAEGRPVAAHNPAGIDYLLGSVDTNELLALPRTGGVLQAIATRPGVPGDARWKAFEEIAGNTASSPLAALIAVLRDEAALQPDVLLELTGILRRQPGEALAAVREDLIGLLRDSDVAEVREGAAAAIMLADGTVAEAWNLAGETLARRAEMLRAISSLPVPALRAEADPLVRPLVGELPPELAAEAASSAASNAARYVRIELPRRGTLTLAEVEVLGDGANLARAGRASQSSTAYAGDAARAIDGNPSGRYGDGSQTHTDENEDHPWWEVDLGREAAVEMVRIWNRSENGGEYAGRLGGFDLVVLDGGRNEIFRSSGNPAPAEEVTIAVSGDPAGRLRRAAILALVSTGRNQAETFALLAGMIARGEERATAAAAVRQLPRDCWDSATAGETARRVLEWAATVEADRRTDRGFVEVVQVADEMAGFLEPGEAGRVRRGLRDLGVSVFVIKAIREQLRFDTPRIVVQTGKPFELVFENTDIIPHNLAVVKPGTRVAVGSAAQTMAMTDVDGQGRAYIPPGDDILAATRLLEDGERGVVSLTAPAEPGDYEFVCTFPGHWILMWGRLVVTDDVDAYLRDHPTAPEILPSAGQ